MPHPFTITPLRFDKATFTAHFRVTLAADTPTTTHDLDTTSLLAAFPDLRRHRCDNGRHRSFATEMKQTECVHVLEHLSVELLAQTGVPRDQARGKTGWNFKVDGPRTYRLHLQGAPDAEQAQHILDQAVQVFSQILK